jgi:hypothetical protein
MSYYRIYLLDAGRHIREAQEVQCEDDEAALAFAATAMEGHPAVEVWTGARLVGWAPDTGQDLDRSPAGPDA